jgi:hypothetical protein
MVTLHVPRSRSLGVLPNFLVIGAQRAGTTLLHRILESHPDVYVPYQRKEIHYFDWYYDRGPNWYRSFFPKTEEAGRFRAIGEATPDYLAAPQVPQRIRQTIPQCRLLVILRNPVDRAYSWYLYARRGRYENRGFEEFLAGDATALEWGLYARHLERYLEFFPHDSVQVVIYEELLREPERTLGHLAEFLGLGSGWDDAGTLLREPVNSSRSPHFRAGFWLARRMANLLMRHDLNWPVRAAKRMGVRRLFGTGVPNPELAPVLRSRLSTFYRPDVRRLEALLQRDLSIWT